jgi:glyoxylase-like metal-dependent hydrolase (beta-lactamase superfamily II)
MPDPSLVDLTPPEDPRSEWGLAPFGSLGAVVDLDDRVVRILAPNAGPMTLDGTNTYIVGERGRGEAVIVDPGPDRPEHRQAVERELARRDATCVLLLVTHHHTDHAAAARPWSNAFGCAVAAPTAEIASDDKNLVGEGWALERAGVRIDAVPTPGHSRDHVSYRLDHGPLLTGDHILGRGTSVVASPDGDLESYFASLRRVLDIGPDALFPGHGPELRHDPSAVIEFYIEHRRFRERQIIRLLEDGPQHTTRLVRRIYTDVDERVLPAAAASTRAALEKLAREHRVEVDATGTATLRGS